MVCLADGSAEALSAVDILHEMGHEFTFTARGCESTF